MVKSIHVGVQLGMPTIGTDRDVTYNRFELPIEELRYMVEELMIECDGCGEKLRKGGKQHDTRDVYENPWDEYPTRTLDLHKEKYLSSGEECRDIPFIGYYYGDFHYEFCVDCCREIIVRNPNNGWHEFFRYEEEGPICLRCYEEGILKFGVEREDIEDGRLPGMFFDYGNPELKAAGYIEHGRYFVNSRSKDSVREEILKIMDAGYQVVIGYERLANTGDEGHISVHIKNVYSNKQEEVHGGK